MQSNVLAGQFRTDCVCKPGYYSPERAVGEVCDECIEGGYCSGGVDLPVPCGLAVFDNDTIKSQTSDWEWQCVSDDGGYFGTGGKIFFSCEGDHCLGGEANKCAEGHAGRLCSRCEDGWFSIGGMDCYECPGGKGRCACWLVAWDCCSPRSFALVRAPPSRTCHRARSPLAVHAYFVHACIRFYYVLCFMHRLCFSCNICRLTRAMRIAPFLGAARLEAGSSCPVVVLHSRPRCP